MIDFVIQIKLLLPHLRAIESRPRKSIRSLAYSLSARVLLPLIRVADRFTGTIQWSPPIRATEMFGWALFVRKKLQDVREMITLHVGAISHQSRSGVERNEWVWE